MAKRENRGDYMRKEKRKVRSKALLALLIAMTLLVGNIPMYTVTADDTHSHDNMTAWTSTNSLPSNAGNYCLENDVTISGTWNVPSGTTNLCLNGHGIKMTGNSSVMTVSAGATLKIYDCDTETEHRFSVSNKKSNGAGFATVNDSLTSGYETFTGGYITGGKGTRVNNWSRGGAFYISGAVEMYGGTVIGNGQYGTTHGGGFSTIESGTFKMYGGSIQNNAGQCGGATRLQGAVCEILGGKIINNVVSADGGGIHVGGTIPVILKDCEISGNYAENGPGAGIWMTTTGTEVSGSTVIENNLTSKGASNIELGNGYTIAVGTLNNDAKIGIKMNNGTGVFTSGWNTHMSGKDPANYFTSDNSLYGVILNSNEAAIGDPPAASIINGSSESKYSTLSDAINNWSAGSTLKLLKDVSTSSTITVPTGEHTLDLNGYGILMTGNGRVLTINKNVSLELNDSNPERIHYITLSDYRGTAVSNSGETSVSNGNGVIKVTGGYLTGGFLNNSGSHDKCGAGVFNWGTFVMNGGSIVGNIMQNNSGGGIRNSGFFTMNDGTIFFNKASANGGGVTTYVPGGGQGKMTMNGGVISDNYCGSYGGGIQLAGPFELTGGSVTRNTAGTGGSGVFYGGQGDKFKLSGNPIIKDNVNDDLYLNADATFMISDSLTKGADIGILMKSNAAFTVGWSTYMSGEDPADYFTSNDRNYAVALVGGEATIGNYAASIKKNGSVEVYSSISDAVNNWTDGSTLKLLKDVSTSSTITVPTGEHTLDLGGHGIRRTGTGCVIRVGAHSTLNLKDSNTSTEHKYKTANPAANGAGVATVDDTLTSGYKTFTGGYITGGYNNGGYNYGAGINIEGDGATLNMYGGTIIGNKLAATSTGGGGVCVQDWDRTGGFNMYGGSIIGNTSNYGGGVYVRCGTMVMHDGEINNNVASNNIGGAILAYSDKSTFIMEGGTINGNTATHGGAIEASGGATVSIFGGTITNNTASGKGGALTNQRVNEDTSTATFNISGAPVFSGNTAGGKASDVYLCNTAVLNVTDELTSETPILVSRSSGSGVFTSGWKDKMGETDPADYFTAEVSNYQVRRIRNGEAYVGPPHTHNWGYVADGDTITATCSEYESGLCILDKQTIKISAEGKTYDGSAVTATLTKSDDWTTDNGLSVPTIQYSGNTDAGTYTASITCGTATASAEFTIDEASMADEVSDEGYTGDYDGKAHSITVTKPSGATIKYGTESGSYPLDENPTYTEAGEYTVYYQVSKKNYVTVAGSQTVTIGKINTTVTVVGNSDTVIYDGKEHTVTGYTATADNALYDVDNDFTFSGTAAASQTDAGTSNMGLEASQFTNTNANFDTVTFDVTDGYITVNKTPAVVTTAPKSKSPTYNGSKQALVTAGKAEGGTIWYALGSDAKKLPSDRSYKTTVPEGKNTGSYYVWYKVIADKNHNDLQPLCVKVVISEKTWVNLKGTLYLSNGKTPAEDATVTIKKGKQKVDYVITPDNGKYKFTVPSGIYNLVVEYKNHTETILVNVTKDKDQDIVMLGNTTDSLLTVNGDDNFGVAVGGLNKESLAVRNNESVPDDKNVTVSMTVESKTEKNAKNAKQFSKLTGGKSFMFFDATLEKTVDSKTTVMNSANDVLEIAVPYTKTARRGICVYYSNGKSLKEYEKNSNKEAGTFRIDKNNGYIFIYTKNIATFAIGYTPYYRVNSSLSLGSFKGKVSVTIKGKNGEGTYRLKDVNRDKVSFDNVPKGDYEMEITWADGANNTITMPFTVS
ncbi:MAG: hypothetical protein IJS03_02800 [Eubacterium sp.]|nr:hypothetical protein [Eubacterium sp.]